MISRNRTPSKYVYYGLHLYFSGLSLRKASERLSQLYKRNHVAIWNWIQKYRPQKLKATRRRIREYVVDETMLKVWSEYIWLWVAIEPENRQILALFLPKVSKERKTCLLLKDIFLVWSKFMESIQSLQRWRYLVPNGMSVSQARPPYPFFLGEKFDRNRKIQYIKDRTECFDDYFPCKLKNCKLKHVRNWLNLFIAYHNKELKPVK